MKKNINKVSSELLSLQIKYLDNMEDFLDKVESVLVERFTKENDKYSLSVIQELIDNNKNVSLAYNLVKDKLIADKMIDPKNNT